MYFEAQLRSLLLLGVGFGIWPLPLALRRHHLPVRLLPQGRSLLAPVCLDPRPRRLPPCFVPGCLLFIPLSGSPCSCGFFSLLSSSGCRGLPLVLLVVFEDLVGCNQDSGSSDVARASSSTTMRILSFSSSSCWACARSPNAAKGSAPRCPAASPRVWDLCVQDVEGEGCRRRHCWTTGSLVRSEEQMLRTSKHIPPPTRKDTRTRTQDATGQENTERRGRTVTTDDNPDRTQTSPSLLCVLIKIRFLQPLVISKCPTCVPPSATPSRASQTHSRSRRVA